ncbi:MAG: lysylphosphatidylglycerol synthase transmembrane domain-containing protein [Kiritimatiellae bacterium]|nr:lysylphosphatidylglycerol synthase transmembrane domain-containing protein [Kiritimatiellia bacterium]MDD5521216.1 lysylphosphatidylglycerol synthase transmembrane domain-containing protein [Kiritimatiellia bacterium]
MKKKLITLVQLALGIGLITFFFIKIAHSGKITDFKIAIQSAADNWHFLVFGTALYLLCLVICTTRWVILLKAQNVHLTFPRTLILYFIGHFFSSFMPGATSGDLIKAIYVAREVPDKKTEVVSTVFIDRIIGLVALIILSIAIMITRLKFFLAYKETRVALVFNLVLLGITLAGSFIVFKRNLLEKWSFFSKLEQKTRLGKIITKAYNAFHVCINYPGVLRNTIVLSLLNHVIFIGVAFFFGLSLKVQLNYVDYLTVFPVINAIAALPITPGGLGMREGAAIFLLGALNIPSATALALSLLVYLSTLFWALVGGVVYIVFVYKTGYDARKDITAEAE